MQRLRPTDTVKRGTHTVSQRSVIKLTLQSPGTKGEPGKGVMTPGPQGIPGPRGENGLPGIQGEQHKY